MPGQEGTEGDEAVADGAGSVVGAAGLGEAVGAEHERRRSGRSRRRG